MSTNFSFRKALIDNESGKQLKGKRVVVDYATGIKMEAVISLTSRQVGAEFAGRYNSLAADGERFADANKTVIIYYAQDGVDIKLDAGLFMPASE